MFPAALLSTAKIRKQSRCLSTDASRKKMWYRYTVEYYTALRNAVLSLAAKQMEMNSLH